MNILKSLPEDLDLYAQEVTLDTNGLSENTYPLVMNPNKLASNLSQYTGSYLLGILCAAVPLLNELDSPIKPSRDWFMIGRSEANGVNYFEDTIGVSVNNYPSEELLAYLNIPKSRAQYHHGFYSLKFKLESKKTVLKITESFLDFDYPLNINLPENMARFPEEGRHINDPQLAQFRDIYTIYKLTGDRDKEKLEDHFGVEVPFYGLPSDRFIYLGILYDIEKNKTAKVKQYYYPNRNLVDVVKKIDYRTPEINQLMSI